jgi:hypothetical protein
MKQGNTMDPNTVYLNGVDGETGKPLVEPFSFAEAAALARPAEGDALLTAMRKRVDKLTSGESHGLPIDVDQYDVAQAGWGIVFAQDTPDDVRKALEPLIEHRRKSIPAKRLKVLEYRKGESHLEWIERHGISLGDVSPKVIPYYLLLIGGPSSVPFDFQYMLDIDYAVGRLAFDCAAEYGRYVQSILDYEKPGAAVPTKKQMIYWSPRYDPATTISADRLVRPLYEGLPDEPPVATERGLEQLCMLEEDATKAALADVLHGRGATRPAMLFTASHGVGFRADSDQQRSVQGALRCQDHAGGPWTGPRAYLSAADVADDAQLHGLVAFFFACYGAGTPAHDDFMSNRSQEARRIAPAPFVAALPQRLLGHPNGGALAVIGHVERAWSYSIEPPNVGSQLIPFRNAIWQILAGRPVGVATKDFSDRYAASSTFLLRQMGANPPGKKIDDEELVRRWIQRNDAQNYVLLGDPAVRLRPSDMR